MRAILVLALLLPLAASGAEEASKPWSGTAALGILATSGNSENTTSNIAIGLKYDRERWHHSAVLAANGASSTVEVQTRDGDTVEEKQTSAERYKAGYEARYDFTEHDFLFGLVNYEKDKFSGYEQQLSEAVGYGRRLINDERQVLNVQVGAGFKQSDLRGGMSESGAIVRLGGDYQWTISPTAKFNQNIVIEKDSENTYVESVSAVKATLIEQLGIVFSYTIKNNSDVPAVPAGLEKTDTFTAISLEYGF